MKNRNEDTTTVQFSYSVFTILKIFFQLITMGLHKKKAPYIWSLFYYIYNFFSLNKTRGPVRN